MDRAALRASDADRERAVDLLRGHAQAGRLTVEELDERCSRAFSAVTFGELDAVTADLPPISAPPAAIAPPSRPQGRRAAAGATSRAAGASRRAPTAPSAT